MNKLGYQPLPVILRAEPSDARWTSNSAKFLRVVATLGTLFALCGAVVICLLGFSVLRTRKPDSKATVNVPILQATTMSPATAASQDNDTVAPLPNPDQAHRATIAEDHSIVDQVPTPALNAAPTPAVPQPPASVTDSELLKGERPEAVRTNLARQLSEPVRKKLEKVRRQAERKRSRLEEMYRTHAISSEEYKTGEEKYRTEIERYRTAMNARKKSQDEGAGQN
jgi:hypothetical protein